MSSCFCFHVYNTDSGTHFQASFHHLLISVKRLEQLLSFLPFMFAEWSVLSHHKKAVRSKFSANNIQISAKKKKLSNHHDLWISSLLPTCPFVYFDHLTCLQFVPLMFIIHKVRAKVIIMWWLLKIPFTVLSASFQENHISDVVLGRDISLMLNVRGVYMNLTDS